MKNELTAEDLKRQFSYRQLLSYNSELRSQLNQKKFELSNLKSKQEQIIKNEVELRTKKLNDELIEKDKQIEALKETIAKM